ncbi:type II toxin-antitoxin system CcdA family antitoxin [Aquipuribacter sp. MA13-6]|uniref:type II toxin-antitoxin system CcdA family antitoxin n=1 Tax=unclassified Aquipuribacter TaxID=2635084 RepID=UPI003EED633D
MYLPDELAAEAKAAGLNLSAVTQEAVRRSLAQRSTDTWLAAVPTSSTTARVVHERAVRRRLAGHALLSPALPPTVRCRAGRAPVPHPRGREAERGRSSASVRGRRGSSTGLPWAGSVAGSGARGSSSGAGRCGRLGCRIEGHGPGA